MIPGDSQSARFFVRNDAVGAAVLNVALADVDATAPLNGAFFRSLRVGVAIAGAPGAQRTFTSAATAASLAHAELGSGDAVPVLVSIELPASAQTSAQLTQSVTFAVHVTLGEQEAVIPAVDPPAQRNDGGASHADVSLLSKTGVDAAGLPWALGAVVAGLLLVLFARLRRRRDARLSAAEGWSLRAAASSARARHEPCEPDAAGRVLPGAPPRA
ncbi:hypothetical protein OSC27_11420 [Microbacterium sp. STN6]|uniref:hypothetical protein n=1 Tax=Microbacterium sp. STN6 TaxID=2995588 RepID=UPI002260B864|nr:hypothetical protein [Microbacterium sp. STN6]MCX7522883.1 hypothetical protein [Microbacterium sp. STN6]